MLSFILAISIPIEWLKKLIGFKFTLHALNNSWQGAEERRKRKGDAAGRRIRCSNRCQRRRCSTLCRSNTQIPNKTWSTFSGRQEGIFKVASELSKEHRVLLLLLRGQGRLEWRRKYAFNIESKWRWQRNYQRERQMDMDISAACQAHKWSEQAMTCTCRSMHAQVRRGLQQKFKFFIYKLQTFAKNSIWLEVQRTMDELLGIYIYICEYLFIFFLYPNLSSDPCAATPSSSSRNFRVDWERWQQTENYFPWL